MRGHATRLFATLLGLAAAGQAAGAFHLWGLNELYSNADGSVQFIELTAFAGGQQNLAGHTVQSSSGGQTRTFSFPGNLPGDTNGKRMLLATPGFAALGLVTPDYVIPASFLFPGGGTVNFAEGFDVWMHPALPTGGTLSLNRDGSTATNSPLNFAGATASIGGGAPSGPATAQGLWWAFPAGSESGWGVNITHQGSILFATWFTYDTDGGGLWLVMPSGAREFDTESDGYGGVVMIPTDRYGGNLFRTTGPAFNAQPFDPAAVGLIAVGSASFDFDGSNLATFRYTVNGITQSKMITRQVFALPAPVCAPGGAQPSTPNYQDLWWRAPAGSESGWGVNIAHQGNTLFATWFTYGADRRGMWLVMSNGERTAPNTYAGPLYRTRGPAFNAQPWAGPVTTTTVGTATFTFSDASNGTFSYTLDGISQAKAITRQVYANPTSVCRTQ